LVDPFNYALGLAITGAVYGIGSSPVAGGALTAAEYAGAVAGGTIAWYWFGGMAEVAEIVPWMAGGALAGKAVVISAGVIGAFGAGYAIGSVGQCMVRCGLDPCSY
jgi:hypothetical protein